MSPVEDDTFMNTIYALHGVNGHLAELDSIEGETRKRGGNRGSQTLPIREVIGVTEHGDIGVKVFQVVLRVVGRN